MLKHVWGKWCKVTTAKRTDALVNFYQSWELDEHVDTFSLCLNKQQILCRKVDVEIKNILKTQLFLEKMIERELFKEDTIEEYELKNAADREWSLTLKYFLAIYERKNAFTLAKAKRGVY